MTFLLLFNCFSSTYRHLLSVIQIVGIFFKFDFEVHFESRE